MTEAQEPKDRPISTEEKLKNGAKEEEFKVLVSAPLRPPNSKHNRRKDCGFFPSCSLRRLAIVSIVCGVSCVGIKALILALQAEQACDQELRGTLSRRSRRFSILSILLFVGVLVSLPVLLVLASYVMTLIE
ncbi:transmembrane protein 265 isoform X2 [Dendropsophus ebraccatus]|uniref:transmembrane protein 265 isoform X2 n=1 Tax=Dendropsophus ebraccatus TaxID=150705 RepID=UPI003831ECAC